MRDFRDPDALHSEKEGKACLQQMVDLWMLDPHRNGSVGISSSARLLTVGKTSSITQSFEDAVVVP